MIWRGDTKTILVLLQWGAWSEFVDVEQRPAGRRVHHAAAGLIG
jgi:hypothetical protein